MKMCASIVEYTVGYLVIGEGRTRDTRRDEARSLARLLACSIDRVGPVPTHVGWRSPEAVGSSSGYLAVTRRRWMLC